MEETKQDLVTYKFNELIVHQNKLSLTLCEFFEITNFDPSQFFDSSFWCALNSLEDDEWFELSDDIIEIIGFKGTEKRIDNIRSNLITFIRKHFVEYVDYEFSVLKHLSAKSGSGGHNKMTLKMKRDSFKMVLMKSNTQHSDQIYRYLIAFENHVKKYSIYQYECELYKKNQQISKNNEEIMKKDEEIIKNNEQITQFKAQTLSSQTPPPLNKYQQNRLKSDRVQRYVYIATSKNNVKNDLYKIGLTDNPKSRKIGMNSTHVRNDDIIYFVHTVKSYDADILERLIHTQLHDYKYKERLDNSANEWYMFPIEYIIQLVDYTAQNFNNANTFLQNLTNKVNNNEVTCTDIIQHEIQLIDTTNNTTNTSITHASQMTQTPPSPKNFNKCINMHGLDELENICYEHCVTVEQLHGLTTVAKALRNHTTLKYIKDREVLESVSMRNLRKVAAELNIPNTHTIPSKSLLIDNIVSRYKQYTL